MKLKINDYVYYTLNGICLVSDIKKLKLGNEENEYYILTPINTKQTIFLPTNNENVLSKVKKILSKDEIDQLIINSKSIIIEWPKNSKERNVYFQNLLKLDDLPTTIALIKTIIQRKNDDNKLSPNDLSILSNAQNLIHTSLAYSLKMSNDEVKEYIINLLN